MLLHLAVTALVMRAAMGAGGDDPLPARTVDVVTPLAGKDASVYRFGLRHLLKHVRGVRNVYIVGQPSEQLLSLALQANDRFTAPGQRVIVVDEAVFPFSVASIRGFLKEQRPTEGFDGAPFDGTVATPEVCSRGGPKHERAEWVRLCRQPWANETSADGSTVNGVKLQTWDRAGWMLQQFIKLGCSPELIPGIGDAYLVVDADTVFSEEYWPFPRDGQPSEGAFNYMYGP